MLQPLAIAAVLTLAGLAGGCGAPPGVVGEDRPTPPPTASKPENNVSSNAPINQRFRTLDEYLDWLRFTQAPVDGSWYEEVRPGVYELRTGNLRILGPEGDETPAPRTFTRDQLERQFGFRR